MFDQKNRFVIDHCQKKPTFSSFLPGIAGPKGIPAWVYYNNRGKSLIFGTMGTRPIENHALDAVHYINSLVYCANNSRMRSASAS